MDAIWSHFSMPLRIVFCQVFVLLLLLCPHNSTAREVIDASLPQDYVPLLPPPEGFTTFRTLTIKCDQKFVSTLDGPLNGTFNAPTLINPEGDPRQCVYIFLAGPRQRVELIFTSFGLRGKPPDCIHEYMDIYSEIRSENTTKLVETPFGGRFCGPIPPRRRVSLYQGIALSFFTDKNITLPNIFSGIYRFINTYSSITHTWLNGHPSRWKEFVSNRVNLVQETLPQAEWRFVPELNNPADIASRGITPSKLVGCLSWWHGPSWLSMPNDHWPRCPDSLVPKGNLEERNVKIHAVTTPRQEIWDFILKYSSLQKLFRITAVCQRTVSRFKKRPVDCLSPLTVQEIETAKHFWIKFTQRHFCSQEIASLTAGHSVSRTSSILRLTPYLDSNELLRVGGRLQHAPLPIPEKHPLILPKASTLTTLIISDAHLRTLHGGTKLTLSFIRTDYWIVGGRIPVRAWILRCIRCARFRQKRAQQLMGQLPPERVSPSKPSSTTGVDYAEAFIAAYKRFTARRGICSTLFSDCGTTLKGSNTELRRLFGQATQESTRLATLLSNDGTQWKFNPPSAPHFGGIWEAGVKSMKHHLLWAMGNTVLTYEELNTLLVQIEAVVNPRPLCPLTEDPDDLTALTPGHFLMGCALATVPESSLELQKTTCLSRWQLTRRVLDSFWNRWSKECLQRHYSKYKWNQEEQSLSVGALVLVLDERYPPSKWPMGRIIETHPGKDGHTRVVTVRTMTSILKRPIVKICPLPLEH